MEALRIVNIKREDFWDKEIQKMVTVYSEVTKRQLEDITHDLKQLGFNIVTFGTTLREFETDKQFVIVRRK
jgi:hypothetical protein